MADGHVVEVALAEGIDEHLRGAIEELGRRLLVHLAELPEARERGPALELSVLLTDDPGIQALNRDFRSKDAPTDVLSFEQGGPLLGDVILSVQTAQARVGEGTWALEDELLFLLIHGVLHLLGHDHHETDEQAAMEAAEQALWTAMGRVGTLRE